MTNPKGSDSGGEEPRANVVTAEELASLEIDEIMEGYKDGWHGENEPGGNRSKAYWHGWRNGHNDRAGISDADQRKLAAAVKSAPTPEVTG